MIELSLNKKYRPFVILAGILCACAVGFFFYRLVKLFFIAAGIAYVVNPVIEWMCRRKINRIASIFIVFTAFILIGILIIVPFAQRAVKEVDSARDKLPVYQKNISVLYSTLFSDDDSSRVSGYIARLKKMYEESLKDSFQPEEYLNSFLKSFQNLSVKAGQKFFSWAGSFFSKIFDWMMIPIIVFYLLKDSAQISAAFKKLLNFREGKQWIEVLRQIDQGIAAFLRGQFIVSIIIGVIMTIGLVAFDVDFALIIGPVAGFSNMVPYLGVIAGLVPSIVIAFLKFGFTADCIFLIAKIIVLFSLLQALDGMFLSPRIIGDSVELHPLIILFALLAGGSFGGIPGMVLAVPAAIVVKVLALNISVRFKSP